MTALTPTSAISASLGEVPGEVAGEVPREVQVVDLRRHSGLTRFVYPLGGGRSRDRLQVVVEVGQTLAPGQCVAVPVTAEGARVHTARAGQVLDVDSSAVVIAPRAAAPGGAEGDRGALRETFRETFRGALGLAASGVELTPLERIREAGVSGHGGAGFPLAAKIDLALAWPGPRHLVLNALECEPPLGCDRVALELEGGQVLAGLAAVAKVLGITEPTVVVGAATQAALDRVLTRADVSPRPKVVRFPDEYTLGDERRLLERLYGRARFADRRPSADGMVVLNVGTALATARAVFAGSPQIERYLTVVDERDQRCWHARVPIGALVGEVLTGLGLRLDGAAGRRSGGELTLRAGGYWMGRPVTLDAPVTVGTNGLVVSAPALTPDSRACIGCGRCDAQCPYALSPERMLARTGVGDPVAQRELARCTLCARCVPSCPSQIPIVDLLREHKQALVAEAEAEAQASWAAARSEAHQQRVERRRSRSIPRSVSQSISQINPRSMHASDRSDAAGSVEPVVHDPLTHESVVPESQIGESQIGESQIDMSRVEESLAGRPLDSADVSTGEGGSKRAMDPTSEAATDRIADAVARVRARRARRAGELQSGPTASNRDAGPDVPPC